jgi:hypothetical protein
MPEQIVDGRGTGHVAQVDDHGRLHVLANMVSHPAHHASYHQDFFYSYHTTVVPGGSVETDCALIEGVSSTVELEIYAVLVSSDQNCLIQVYYDALYTSGGAELFPVNSNRNSNKTLQGAFYEGGASADLVLDTTNKIITTGFAISANQPFSYPVDGTVILGNDKSLLFSATSASEANLRITIGLTPHAAGTKL